ncbi:hypothetical protein V2J09_009227 [Rumex salicifolius]
MRGELIRRRRELERRELKLMRREELLWLQCSKANEFKGSDQDSNFFHMKVSGRRKRNKIKKLVDKNGMEWRSFEGKTKVALECASPSGYSIYGY